MDASCLFLFIGSEHASLSLSCIRTLARLAVLNIEIEHGNLPLCLQRKDDKVEHIEERFSGLVRFGLLKLPQQGRDRPIL